MKVTRTISFDDDISSALVVMSKKRHLSKSAFLTQLLLEEMERTGLKMSDVKSVVLKEGDVEDD